MATHPHEPGTLAAAGGSVPSNTAEQRPLATFQLLPTHLSTTIITMACSMPRDEAKESNKFLPPLDPQPAKTLALVSKSFYAVACSVLYAHIRLTRISSLKLLVDAVISRPPLGRLIKSLHIGADEVGNPRWIPMEPNEVILRLWLPEDQGRWPAWIKGETFYHLSLEPITVSTPPEAVKAIVAAIKSACYTLNLDLGWPLRDRDDHWISAVRSHEVSAGQKTAGWSRSSLHPQHDRHCRLFELFAATELYILAMRRCEDEAENESSVRYPSLLIGDEHTSATSGSDCIVLSRSQLLQRLAARGAETDRLDHQLIALRSGLGGHEWGHKSSSVRVSDRAASQMSDQDAMDAYSGIEAQLEDPALSSTATIGGVLSLTRTLLSLTPLLQHLSLAAYLVAAACGPRAPAELRRLRSLSLGPPLSLWSWPIPLRLDIAAFASVERLQLSGHKLSLEQAVTIVGRAGADKGAFPNLREFQWTFPNAINLDETSASSLLDTINVLAGRMAATGEVSADDAQRSHKRSRDTDVGDGGAITLSSILHIEVLLGRREVEHLLAAAPTATTREAWRTGGAPDAAYAQHRRLRIVAMLNSGKADFNGRDELRHLYDEGRKWFEQGAGRGSVCC